MGALVIFNTLSNNSRYDFYIFLTFDYNFCTVYLPF